MPKDERLLKKIGKLLTLYGVEEKEKENFLIDLQDKKYDDPEDEEEVKVDETSTKNENETKVEEEVKPTEEENKGSNEEQETKVEEEQKVEENKLPVEETKVEEEVENKVEEPKPEEPKQEEVKVEEFDAKSKTDELQKSIDGIAARISSIEDIISKLGVEEKPIGASPEGNPVEESKESTFDEINRKRVGF